MYDCDVILMYTYTAAEKKNGRVNVKLDFSQICLKMNYFFQIVIHIVTIVRLVRVSAKNLWASLSFFFFFFFFFSASVSG